MGDTALHLPAGEELVDRACGPPHGRAEPKARVPAWSEGRKRTPEAKEEEGGRLPEGDLAQGGCS